MICRRYTLIEVVVTVLVIVVLAAVFAWAQEPTPPPVPAPAPTEPVPAPPPKFDWSALDWKAALAAFINSTLVLLLVQGIKFVIPAIRLSVPWMLPAATMLIGPLVTVIQNAVAGALGWPIDLSPIIAIFTGGAAVAVHQIGRQLDPMKRVV